MTYMKRYTSAVLLTLSLVVGGLPIANAVITPGSKCSKAGMEKTDNGKIYNCIKSGNKLVWSKGSSVPGYTAFADALLYEAKKNAAQIISEAELSAYQLSNPPNCTSGGSRAAASIGTDQFGSSALVFENSGICELVVRASASFICPDGGTTKLYNSITSSGTFSLKAGEKLFVSANVAYYFPQVLTDCRLLTGYATNIASLNPLQYPPSVIVLSSRYSGVFNQVEGIKKANQLIKSSQARANKIIADAKNPNLIAKAWKATAEAKVASDAKAIADAKAAADKSAAVAECAKSGRNCAIGNTGPGGGVVFYDAGSQQLWGRYLEVAPSDWSATVWGALWCNVGNRYLTADATEASLRAKRGTAIGMGKANTDLMLSSCSAGAAVVTRAYQGGAKSDWSLPSKDELNELCKYARGQATGNSKIICQNFDGVLRGGFTEATYWSSTEDTETNAWLQSFAPGFTYGSGSKNLGFRVRPIRAF
jgi:hypothetical protein